MAEHSTHQEHSERSKSSSSEYGYIGSSTKTGKEERTLRHGGHLARFHPAKKREGDTDDAFKHSYG